MLITKKMMREARAEETMARQRERREIVEIR